MKHWWNQLEGLSHTTQGIAKVGGMILLLGASLIGLFSLIPSVSDSRNPYEDTITLVMGHYYLYQFPADMLLEPPPPLPSEINWIFQGEQEEWLPRLTEETKGEAPKEGLCFARALWHWHDEEFDEAIGLLRRENALYPNEQVRELALTVAMTSGDSDLMNLVTSDSALAQEVSHWFEYSRGVEEQNWDLILKHFIPTQFEDIPLFPLFLTLVAGGIWAVLIFSFTVNRPSLSLILLGLVALVLGALSTWPTILTLLWTEFEFGWTEGTDFFSTLFYMIASVGLREEVLKMLFYAPLLVYTGKEGRDLEALLLGALVGLGFAIEENLSFFARHGASTAVSRFVSANMLHFYLTGITSLALTRAVRNPAKWAMDSFQVLVFAILLHGIYNTLGSQPLPIVGDLSTFAWATLFGCAALFFRELEHLAPPRGTRGITRTAILTWGFCGLVCLELAWAASELPFDQALNLIGQSALAAVFTGYIFVHYIREPIR